MVNRDTNQRVPITSGSMVVTNIYHWDEVTKSCSIEFVALTFFSRSHTRSTSRLRKKTLQANVIFTRCQNNGSAGFFQILIGRSDSQLVIQVTDFQSGQPGLVTCLSCDELNTRGGSCGYNRSESTHVKHIFCN